MRLSVYHIYNFAWLLAAAAIILTAIVLTQTFSAVRKANEKTQEDVGFGQLMTLQFTIQGSMNRMRIETDGKLRQFLADTTVLTEEEIQPDVIVDNLSPMLFSEWTPYIEAADETYGYVVNLLYPINATKYSFVRSVQVYADIMYNGSRQLMISTSNSTDNMEHAREILHPESNAPQIGSEQYVFEWFSSLQNALLDDDFFWQASPWAASDGNAFWYYTYQRYFQLRDVKGTVMTLATGFLWLKVMLAVRAPGAEFVIFDSNNITLVATLEAELERLQKCRGQFADGVIPSSCISSNSAQHPIEDIRTVYNALFQPAWTDLSAQPVPLTSTKFIMHNQPYVAVAGTIFSRNHLRMNSVWYQPEIQAQGNTIGITVLICMMTVLSTSVLSILGIFYILVPLMRLGKGMSSIANSLKDGDQGVVLHERAHSIFKEVDAIGQDFETIVVDFLGFSSAKARDTTWAPKDPKKPFAVIFTDIECSSSLWGKDPVEMARCLQSHHDIIRELIHKHDLFEVKTVGDSFMVTTVSAADAVNFALDLQEDFFAFQWGWKEIEEVYQAAHSAFVMSPRCPSTTNGEYEDLWNGLRVRIGIHYGCGDITYDEVSKGYDYYGPVVNIAARIENAGHGGQILASHSVLRLLKNSVDSQRFQVKDLGVHPLRGIEEPPPLAEIVPLQFVGRKYPPLRVHEEGNQDAALSDADPAAPPETLDSRLIREKSTSISYPDSIALNVAADDIARNHSMVRSGAIPVHLMGQHLISIWETIWDALLPIGPQQRATILTTIFKSWGVPVPQKNESAPVSGLLVAQRMSETNTGILALQAKHRCARPSTSECTEVRDI